MSEALKALVFFAGGHQNDLPAITQHELIDAVRAVDGLPTLRRISQELSRAGQTEGEMGQDPTAAPERGPRPAWFSHQLPANAPDPLRRENRAVLPPAPRVALGAESGYGSPDRR